MVQGIEEERRPCSFLAVPALISGLALCIMTITREPWITALLLITALVVSRWWWQSIELLRLQGDLFERLGDPTKDLRYMRQTHLSLQLVPVMKERDQQHPS